MDIKSISCATAQSKLFRQLVRDHVKNQSNARSTIPFAERGSVIGFYRLSQDDKRQVVSAALVSRELSDCDMTVLDDDSKTIESLTLQSILGKIKPYDVLNTWLDAIATEKSHLIEEIFDEEWQNYFSESSEIPCITNLDLEISAYNSQRLCEVRHAA